METPNEKNEVKKDDAKICPECGNDDISECVHTNSVGDDICYYDYCGECYHKWNVC